MEYEWLSVIRENCPKMLVGNWRTAIVFLFLQPLLAQDTGVTALILANYLCCIVEFQYVRAEVSLRYVLRLDVHYI